MSQRFGVGSMQESAAKVLQVINSQVGCGGWLRGEGGKTKQDGWECVHLPPPTPDQHSHPLTPQPTLSLRSLPTTPSSCWLTTARWAWVVSPTTYAVLTGCQKQATMETLTCRWCCSSYTRRAGGWGWLFMDTCTIV